MNENWYNPDYWNKEGEWGGCPHCDECDGERPSEPVTFYIPQFYEIKDNTEG